MLRVEGSNPVVKTLDLALGSSRVDQALAAGRPSGFSENASARLVYLSARHTEELALVAIGIAAANSLDFVSASDVEAASRSLIPRRRGARHVMEVVGGLVAGAGLSEFASAVTAPHASGLAFSLAAAGVAAGATLLSTALAGGR